jgi:hypothetical protein
MIADPLAGAALTVVVTLPESAAPRLERPMLVSLGQAGVMPVTRSGVLSELPETIAAVWLALANQQVADAAGEPETASEETAAPIIASVAVAAAPMRAPQPASNLSLF